MIGCLYLCRGPSGAANTSTAIRLRRVAFPRNSADSGRRIMPGTGHEREFETVARVQEVAKQHGTPITTLSVSRVTGESRHYFGHSWRKPHVEQLTDTLAAPRITNSTAH